LTNRLGWPAARTIRSCRPIRKSSTNSAPSNAASLRTVNVNRSAERRTNSPKRSVVSTSIGVNTTLPFGPVRYASCSAVSRKLRRSADRST
jgi:hypothetical protein